MIIFLIVGIFGLIITSEIFIKSTILRSAIMILACWSCVVLSAVIARKFGDAMARNSIITVVSDTFRFLERREMEGMRKAERLKLIKDLSEQLPSALMDDRKSTIFLNKLEHGGDYWDEK